jgi:AraC-like DNA-binding protein
MLITSEKPESAGRDSLTGETDLKAARLRLSFRRLEETHSVPSAEATEKGREMPQYLQIDRNWEKLAKEAHYKPSSLARACGVSLRTLQRHFSEKYSLTVSSWLTSVRLREAYERITAGARVKEVAFDLGYKQLSHFSREFKRFHGIAPSFLNGRPATLLGNHGPIVEPVQAHRGIHIGYKGVDQSAAGEKLKDEKSPGGGTATAAIFQQAG